LLEKEREEMRRPILTLAAVLVVVLAACDNGSEPPAGSSTTAAAGSDTTATSTADPTVTFDGATCAYAGPTEFGVGSENEFVLHNNTNAKTGIVLAQIDDGLTIDDIVRIGIEDVPFPGKTYTRDAEPGGQAVVNPVFDEPSPWLVMCFVRDPDATDSAPAGDHPSVVFAVGNS
jgi:hypothetical protein